MTIQNFLKRSANRATFEADKLQRAMKVQNAISRLRTQVKNEVVELGQAALTLHRQGGLVENELQDIAKTIETLEAQITEQEAKLAEIKAETPPELPEEIPSSNTHKFCHQCGQSLPPEIRFCVHCGSKLLY